MIRTAHQPPEISIVKEVMPAKRELKKYPHIHKEKDNRISAGYEMWITPKTREVFHKEELLAFRQDIIKFTFQY